MKKTVLISLVAVALFSACKKDRTCVCTTNAPNGALIIDETKYFKVTKKEANSSCLDHQTISNVNGTISYGNRINCKLK